MSLVDFIPKQNVKYKISSKGDNYIKVNALQNYGTPGIMKKFKVKTHTHYTLTVTGFKNAVNPVFIYLVSVKKNHNLIPNKQKYELTNVLNTIDIKFYTYNYTSIYAGLLFNYPTKGDKFYLKTLSLNNKPKKLPKPPINLTAIETVNKTIQIVAKIEQQKITKEFEDLRIKLQHQNFIDQETKKLEAINLQKEVEKKENDIANELITVNQELLKSNEMFIQSLDSPIIEKEEVKVVEVVEIPEIKIENKIMKFVFVVTGYNCDKWIEKCVKSILKLERDNWMCILCDDASTDTTWKKMLQYENKDKIYLYRNDVNMGACYTRYYAIEKWSHLIDNEDVILLIGGDDHLGTSKVINILEKAYKKGAQVTYGNWCDNKGSNHELKVLPDKVIRDKSYRKYRWVTTAINTFKYYLFKNIPITEYQEPDGKWIKNCTDLAVMFPVLEQATKIVPIHDILYIYNSRYAHNTISRFGLKDKQRLNKVIRSKHIFK
jgi:Glycosyl transferase family 2